LKIRTAEYMLSDSSGTGFKYSWFPRVVVEAFLGSTKDGDIKISPDPVTQIIGDIAWNNADDAPQHVWVSVHRAPRSIVAQSPATVVIHDAWSFQVAEAPFADYPSVIQDTFGGRMAIDRPSAAAKDLLYGRYFLDGDDSLTYVDIGDVPPGWSFHFRYLAAVQTPGVWTTPSEFDPRWEANARWVRLQALAVPVDVSTDVAADPFYQGGSTS
jgi:hypothetical protein